MRFDQLSLLPGRLDNDIKTTFQNFWLTLQTIHKNNSAPPSVTREILFSSISRVWLETNRPTLSLSTAALSSSNLRHCRSLRLPAQLGFDLYCPPPAGKSPWNFFTHQKENHESEKWNSSFDRCTLFPIQYLIFLARTSTSTEKRHPIPESSSGSQAAASEKANFSFDEASRKGRENQRDREKFHKQKIYTLHTICRGRSFYLF